MVEFCLGLYYGSGSKRRLDKLPFLLEKMIFYHCWSLRILFPDISAALIYKFGWHWKIIVKHYNLNGLHETRAQTLRSLIERANCKFWVSLKQVNGKKAWENTKVYQVNKI